MEGFGYVFPHIAISQRNLRPFAYELNPAKVLQALFGKSEWGYTKVLRCCEHLLQSGINIPSLFEFY